jgi:hypothetical protein
MNGFKGLVRKLSAVIAPGAGVVVRYIYITAPRTTTLVRLRSAKIISAPTTSFKNRRTKASRNATTTPSRLAAGRGASTNHAA